MALTLASNAITFSDSTSLSSGNIQGSQIVNGTVNFDKFSSTGSFNFRNKVINGAMRVDQRNNGTAINVTAGVNSTTRGFGVDRMHFDVVGPASVQLVRSVDAPPNFQNSLRCTLLTPNTNLQNQDRVYVMHILEGYNISNFGFNKPWCKTLTLSFWVKSSIPGKYTVALFYDILGGGSMRRSFVVPYQIDQANTWEFKTLTILPDPSSGIDPDLTVGIGAILLWNLGEADFFRTATPNVWYNRLGTFPFNGPYTVSDSVKWVAETVNSTFLITGIQLEEGPVATPFEHLDVGTDLYRCLRYYYRTNPGGLAGVSTASQANVVSFHIPFLAPMRIIPTVVNANDPPRVTVPSIYYMNAQTQAVNGYNITWEALNAEF